MFAAVPKLMGLIRSTAITPTRFLSAVRLRRYGISPARARAPRLRCRPLGSLAGFQEP